MNKAKLGMSVLMGGLFVAAMTGCDNTPHIQPMTAEQLQRVQQACIDAGMVVSDIAYAEQQVPYRIECKAVRAPTNPQGKQ